MDMQVIDDNLTQFTQSLSDLVTLIQEQSSAPEYDMKVVEALTEDIASYVLNLQRAAKLLSNRHLLLQRFLK